MTPPPKKSAASAEARSLSAQKGSALVSFELNYAKGGNYLEPVLTFSGV